MRLRLPGSAHDGIPRVAVGATRVHRTRKEAVMDVHIRNCTVCGSTYTVPRTVGRPRARCSERCQTIAQRQHRVNYILRRAGLAAAA